MTVVQVLAMIQRWYLPRLIPWLLAILCAAASGFAQPAPTAAQSETDEYTRYELLAPGARASFAIRYEVTATRRCEVLLQSHPQGQRGQRESVLTL